MLKVHVGPRRLRPTFDDAERAPYRRITPEPMSIVLVAASLAGLGIAHRMRSRRR